MPKEKKLRVNTLNEQIVLATVIQDSDLAKIILKKVNPDDFVAPRHVVIYETVVKLDSKSYEYTEDTFAQLAGDDDFGGFEYLNEVLEAYEPNPNIDYHIDTLKTDRLKFKLFKGAGGDLYESLMSRGATAQEIIQLASEVIDISRTAVSSDAVIVGQQVADDYMADFNNRSLADFIGTGFDELDDILIDGFAPGQVSVIASRPAIGKTQLTTNFIVNWGRESRKMLICEVEMGNIDFQDLLIANLTGITLDDLIKNPEGLTDNKKQRVQNKIDYVAGNANYNFLDKSDLTLRELEGELRAGDYDICIVDLFTRLVDVTDEPQVLTEKLQQVKRIARSTATHICLIHQIRRFGDKAKKKDFRPNYEQLKGSGAWEECADLIMLLHREGYYDKTLVKQILEIDIAKQKRGQSREVIPYEFRGAVVEIGEFQADFIMGRDLSEF